MSKQTLGLEGKLIVVTGGLGILGQAVAKAAMENGAIVALIDRVDPTGADHAAALLVGGVDLAELSSAQEAFKRIADKLGPIHALMNIAGAFDWQKIIGGGIAPWTDLHRANVLTAVGASLAAIAHMPDGASIVNVAAAATVRSGLGMGAYTASKSGVLRFTEAMAEELKPRGIRVNSVSPTVLDTPRNRIDMPDVDPATWLQPSDLAKTMLFLASPESRAMNGANLLVGG